MSLVADNVSYSYPSGAPGVHRALSDASVTLERGSVMLVVGQTGSGKSTLLRLLSGLLGPTAGTVLLEGSTPAPGDVGLVFQQPEQQLFAETVLDDVMFGPLNLGVPVADARTASFRALETVGLDPRTFADRSPFSLSGGEARRAAIAGVLAMGRRYLLLDEPTAGLDAPGRRFVRKMLVDLAASGVGVAVASHAIDDLLPVSDRVVMVRSGEILFDVERDEALRSPELFDRAGLKQPALLELQSLARAQGFSFGDYSMDPGTVGRMLMGARSGVKKCL